ncbi:hypothetical protein [uncultured Leifsonia sp.]|uniref:hypothetical protein n=1 Tax=uncultured Leifsonia sp. TaxID=340359 RepID=UPI0025D580A5|nr:hypothetical protein [uncultured Leifsonia sp.]
MEVQSFARLRELDDGHTLRGDFPALALVDGGHGCVTIHFRTFSLLLEARDPPAATTSTGDGDGARLS